MATLCLLNNWSRLDLYWNIKSNHNKGLLSLWKNVETNASITPSEMGMCWEKLLRSQGEETRGLGSIGLEQKKL